MIENARRRLRERKYIYLQIGYYLLVTFAGLLAFVLGSSR